MIFKKSSASQGFEKVFEESFNRLFDSLHRYSFSMVKDDDTARDVVQMVFIKWWEIGTAIADLTEARKYLFTAVYRSSLNAIRNEKLKKVHTTAYGHEQVKEIKFHDATEMEELDSKIKLAIESLPAQCRIIFCKSRMEEKKYAEIATDMNLSVKTVEAQMGKALKILREKLNNDLNS
ncbi:MAG TPA: RNA polymerase sigma-70 factor [Cyclobacteriaceae bacterium]|nr:RNA polymerase sigma-70 factor [Cyclobacteriaceae bacterium]